MIRSKTRHICQLKNGLWEGQYIYKREHRSIYGKTQKEVSQQLDEIITSIEKENYIRPNQHWGSIPMSWFSTRRRGIRLRLKFLKMVSRKSLLNFISKASISIQPCTPSPPKPCKRQWILLQSLKFWDTPNRPPP